MDQTYSETDESKPQGALTSMMVFNVCDAQQLYRKVMGLDDGPLTPDAITSLLHHSASVGDGWCAHRSGHGHTWNHWGWSGSGVWFIYPVISNSKVEFCRSQLKTPLPLAFPMLMKKHILYSHNALVPKALGTTHAFSKSWLVFDIFMAASCHHQCQKPIKKAPSAFAEKEHAQSPS